MANVLKEAKKYRKAHPKVSWDKARSEAAKLMKRGAVGAKPKKAVKRKTTVTVKVGAVKKRAAPKKAPAKKKVATRAVTTTKKVHQKSEHTMAHKRKKHHHSKRVGAAPAARGVGSVTQMVVGGVAGGILATGIQRVLGHMNPKLIGGLQVAAGIGAAMYFKKPIFKGLGFGVATAGAVGLAHDFGVLHGVENMLGGISNYATLNGIANDQYITDYRASEPAYQVPVELRMDETHTPNIGNIY